MNRSFTFYDDYSKHFPLLFSRKDRKEPNAFDIKATFKKFNSDQLGETTEGTVKIKPFLHLYWTSCMVSYRVL